jgi:hypothetical protein
MIRTAITVVDGTIRFQVIVHAVSIRQAVEIVEDRFRGSYVQVVFPLDPELFFVKDATAKAGLMKPKPLEELRKETEWNEAASGHEAHSSSKVLSRDQA